MDSNIGKSQMTDVNKIAYNICTINIAGLSARSKFVLEKYCYDKSIDILAVQESFSNESVNQNLRFMKSVSDNNNSANRGSMLFVNSQKLSIIPLDELSNISKEIDTAWGLVTGPGIKMIVGSVYLKLNYSGASKDLITMLSQAQILGNKLGAHGISVLGDFNARHTLWGDSTSNKYGKELVEQLDFTQFSLLSSDGPTFLSSNGQSYIDFAINSLSNEQNFSDLVTDPEVELFAGAPIRGHVPVHCTYTSVCSQKNVPPKEKLDLTTIDWDDWSNRIETLLKENIPHEALLPERKWELLNDAIHKATKETCATKISSVHSKPYWTSQLTEASKHLRDAKKAYGKRNTISNKEKLDTAKEFFDELRKKECQKFILMRTKSLNVAQATKFWKQFNQMFCKKNGTGVETLIDDNGPLLSEPAEMEGCLFASFFDCKHLNVKGVDFDKLFLEEVNKIYSDILEDPALHSHSSNQFSEGLETPITLEEVEYFIKQYTSSGKSFDNYEFHPQMLKHLGPEAKQRMVSLFNSCMHHGTWVWNLADVIFIKKDGKKNYSKAGSYRPISITSYIGKIFEQLIAARLEKFLQSVGLHDENQEGFTKRKNTIRYLNRLDSDIQSSLNKKYTVICLFIDFEKAFDSVWKKGLMKKLFDSGVKGAMWKIINSFLFTRKVRLVFNGYTGLVRACQEFGLPQGSALSPILFKFFVHDLAMSLRKNPNVSTYKFADDGTLKVQAPNTPECLQLLKHVCDEVYKWSSTWRMVINCDVSKTELICFGTSEKDESPIPATFSLGKDMIRFVSSTKVLGLIVDKDLSYIEHGKYVNRKILHRWVTICKHTNRNWGFKQHVIVRLCEVLMCTSICYAGIIWMNPKSLAEVGSTWYRILKAAIGAVFNISLMNAEILLGILPLEFQNRINSIKHLLKLNILPISEDPLKKLITCQLKQCSYSRLTSKVKDTFQFLKWKRNKFENQFSTTDLSIIDGNHYDQYSELSPISCSYSKGMVRKYGEILWQTRTNILCQLEGFHESPKVSSSKLTFDSDVSRKQETLTMSLFYPNNLLLSFLNRFDPAKYPTLQCSCGKGEQSPLHILLYCMTVKSWNRDSVFKYLHDTKYHSLEAADNQRSLLLSWSREPGFLLLCVDIIKNVEHILKFEITL